MNGPVVSVVIPCYNGSVFLAECLRSVQQQETHCEIILVDDGSTDDSVEQARALLRGGLTRMLVVNQHNQGPAAARNTGLRLAQGKYVCFLDVDDQLGSGFCSSAVQLLESDPTLVAVFSQIEIVDAHRQVLPWQQELMEASLPSNIVLRTEAARDIGGFPTQRAFRGQAAGEDYVFRSQLAAHGKVVKILKPLFKYRAQRGSHFDFFLDRVSLREGRLEFSRMSQEESDGSLLAAVREYQQAVHQRALARTGGLMEAALGAGLKYHLLSEQFAPVQGFLHPYEGFVLYWLAKHWPCNGRVVEIGSFKGRSTCWLATGSKEGGRAKVAAVDHFRGSPEHQLGGSHEDPDIIAHGSTLPTIQANLKKNDLADWVTIHAGDSTEIARGWSEPIRLLFIDGDHSYEATAHDFNTWTRFVVQRGLVIFHDVQVWPGVTRFHTELCSQQSNWRSLGCYHTLGIMERRS